MKAAKNPLALLLIFLMMPGGVWGDEIRVAAASNFRETSTELARVFEAASTHEVVLIFGSTGKHYAQVINGAPFDVMLAADSARPEKLEKTGLAIQGTRFTYALGRLALWSPEPGYVDSEGKVLSEAAFRHLAIANPVLAPYGQAAREALEALGQWDRLRPRLVMGENVGQAFQYVTSGNAELGLLAWSQLPREGARPAGSWWLLPENLHQPIAQQAVMLKDSAAARAFLDFLGSAEGVAIIRRHGYGIADDL